MKNEVYPFGLSVIRTGYLTSTNLTTAESALHNSGKRIGIDAYYISELAFFSRFDKYYEKRNNLANRARECNW